MYRGKNRNEHTTAIKGHAPGSSNIVLLNTLLVDQLLCGDIADRKQDRSGDGLSKERARRKAGLVPKWPPNSCQKTCGGK